MSNELERRRRFEEVAAEVFDPLQRYLRRRANSDDADDVFNDTLMTLWRRLDDIPAEAVVPWSLGVARRQLANRRRANARHLRLIDRIVSMAPPPEHVDPSTAFDHPELGAALVSLSEADREIITLWAWEDLEPRQIAVILETTPNAVSLKLSRARKKLSEEMERQKSHVSGHVVGESTEEHRP